MLPAMSAGSPSAPNALFSEVTVFCRSAMVPPAVSPPGWYMSPRLASWLKKPPSRKVTRIRTWSRIWVHSGVEANQGRC